MSPLGQDTEEVILRNMQFLIRLISIWMELSGQWNMHTSFARERENYGEKLLLGLPIKPHDNRAILY
jgi:hypothetical protein